ncbi:B-type cyclin [Starmerella bacillaris]|uniref:B-type cyclin n=1 Tax=Starmerella bacillaris TaxID=1247836 RepID=A0AAV5RME0_STABA|nr:B-type cyclin [Starmerella bacillaris]
MSGHGPQFLVEQAVTAVPAVQKVDQVEQVGQVGQVEQVQPQQVDQEKSVDLVDPVDPVDQANQANQETQETQETKANQANQVNQLADSTSKPQVAMPTDDDEKENAKTNTLKSTNATNQTQTSNKHPKSGETGPRRPLQTLSEQPVKRGHETSAVHAKKARVSFIEHIDHVSVEPEPIIDENGAVVSDADDEDPQMCSEYAEDIYAYLYAVQEQHMVDPAYIKTMPATHRWRTNRHTLVNWMLTVHRKFRLVAETLYLGVNIVDKFLSRNRVGLDRIQVLGATGLLIAAKLEEIMSPSISNFAYVANSDENAVRKMEIEVLISLNFDFSYANPLNFLRRISKADDYDVRTRTMGKFLLEMQLFEPRLMVYRPSDVAAAAMLLAREVLEIRNENKPSNESNELEDQNENETETSNVLNESNESNVSENAPWSNNFIYYSGGCTRAALQPIVDIMIEYLAGPCEQLDPEYINKYMSKRNLQASLQAANWVREHYE